MRKKRVPPQPAEDQGDGNHPWLCRIDVGLARPCCGLPPVHLTVAQYARALDEAVEDAYVRSAEQMVRAAFEAARDMHQAQNHVNELAP